MICILIYIPTGSHRDQCSHDGPSYDLNSDGYMNIDDARILVTFKANSKSSLIKESWIDEYRILLDVDELKDSSPPKKNKKKEEEK